MTDIITKDEIVKILEKLKVVGYSVEKNKIVYDMPNMDDIANEIISKINENIEIARENEGDESQAQFHHLAQFVYLHGDKTTKGVFKKLIKRMKGI